MGLEGLIPGEVGEYWGLAGEYDPPSSGLGENPGLWGLKCPGEEGPGVQAGLYPGLNPLASVGAGEKAAPAPGVIPV